MSVQAQDARREARADPAGAVRDDLTTERELVRALANIFVGNVGRARDVSAVPFGSFTDVEQERALGRARRRHPSIELLDLERLLPRGRNGRPVHPQTVLRWVRRGVHGVRLEAVKLGGRWVTSRAALNEFIQALQPGNG